MDQVGSNQGGCSRGAFAQPHVGGNRPLTTSGQPRGRVQDHRREKNRSAIVGPPQLHHHHLRTIEALFDVSITN